MRRTGQTESYPEQFDPPFRAVPLMNAANPAMTAENSPRRWPRTSPEDGCQACLSSTVLPGAPALYRSRPEASRYAETKKKRGMRELAAYWRPLLFARCRRHYALLRGGARGFDTLAAEAVLADRETNPEVWAPFSRCPGATKPEMAGRRPAASKAIYPPRAMASVCCGALQPGLQAQSQTATWWIIHRCVAYQKRMRGGTPQHGQLRSGKRRPRRKPLPVHAARR